MDDYKNTDTLKYAKVTLVLWVLSSPLQANFLVTLTHYHSIPTHFYSLVERYGCPIMSLNPNTNPNSYLLSSLKQALI